MLTDARDIAAVIDYGLRLQELREEHLRRVLAGEKIPPGFLAAGENAALDSVRRRYFCFDNRLRLMSRDKARAITDEQDFDSRTTKLTEALTLETHKKILAIPYVGQPDFKDT